MVNFKYNRSKHCEWKALRTCWVLSLNGLTKLHAQSITSYKIGHNYTCTLKVSDFRCWFLPNCQIWKAVLIKFTGNVENSITFRSKCLTLTGNCYIRGVLPWTFCSCIKSIKYHLKHQCQMFRSISLKNSNMWAQQAHTSTRNTFVHNQKKGLFHYVGYVKW